MRVFEHFAVVAVLDDGSRHAQNLTQALSAAGCLVYPAHLDRAGAFPAWYDALQAMPGVQERGILFLDPGVGQDSPLWSRHDGLVERLESGCWDMAYLGHRYGSASPAEQRQRPTLQLSDSVPSGLCALALRGPSLRRVLDAMPTHAATGCFSALDWLTIAAWLGRDLPTPPRSWLAWPTLVHALPPCQGREEVPHEIQHGRLAAEGTPA